MFDGVANGVPDGVGSRVRHDVLTIRVLKRCATKIVAPHQQAVFREFLRVQKVDLAGFELCRTERILYGHEVRDSQFVRGILQAPPRLFVQRWIVAEPDDDRAMIGLKLVVVIAEEQGFNNGGRHHRLSSAGCCGQGEGVFVAIIMPAFARLPEPVEHGRDSVILIILEREFHGSSSHRKPEIVEIGFVKPNWLDPVGETSGDGLKSPLIIGCYIGEADCRLRLDRPAEGCCHVEIGQ